VHERHAHVLVAVELIDRGAEQDRAGDEDGQPCELEGPAQPWPPAARHQQVRARHEAQEADDDEGGVKVVVQLRQDPLVQLPAAEPKHRSEQRKAGHLRGRGAAPGEPVREPAHAERAERQRAARERDEQLPSRKPRHLAAREQQRADPEQRRRE
jgi:hypothetical protein